jgi:hypothetical protein
MILRLARILLSGFKHPIPISGSAELWGGADACLTVTIFISLFNEAMTLDEASIAVASRLISPLLEDDFRRVTVDISPESY